MNHVINPVRGCNQIEYDVNNGNEFTVQNTVLESENTVVSYKDILGVATNLCRTVLED